MFGIHDLPLFVLSGLLLNIAPGPDSLLIASRAARYGWRAGSAAALGIGTGTCVHVLAAAFGLAAVLATSSAAFMVVKTVGAAYLIYIGAQALLAKRPDGARTHARADESEPGRGTTMWRIFLQGLVTNLFNPKVALFFLAFVPQFISSASPHPTWAFLILGAIFNINGMLWCHALAVTAGLAARRIQFSPLAAWYINKPLGALFVSFGVRLATASRA